MFGKEVRHVELPRSVDMESMRYVNDMHQGGIGNRKRCTTMRWTTYFLRAFLIAASNSVCKRWSNGEGMCCIRWVYEDMNGYPLWARGLRVEVEAVALAGSVSWVADMGGGVNTERWNATDGWWLRAPSLGIALHWPPDGTSQVIVGWKQPDRLFENVL